MSHFDNVKRIIGAILLAVIGYYVGAFGFDHICMADDLCIRTIGFSTLIICVCIAISTNQIIKAMKDNKQEKEDKKDESKE